MDTTLSPINGTYPRHNITSTDDQVYNSAACRQQTHDLLLTQSISATSLLQPDQLYLYPTITVELTTMVLTIHQVILLQQTNQQTDDLYGISKPEAR